MIITLSIYSGHAQNTQIPDLNFELALIGKGLDSGTPNGLVPTANIDTLRFINLNRRNIRDLTGIQDFSALITLHASSNKLRTINVSKNISLREIILNHNELDSIDVSSNLKLTVLQLSYNQIKSIDVSKNRVLWTLSITSNLITKNIDISTNLHLRYLFVGGNNISSLDVTNNSNLLFLNISLTKITQIDLSSNILLEWLLMEHTKINNIDLSNNINLTSIFANKSFLRTLDLSSNTAIDQVEVDSCLLECVNLKNRNNSRIITFSSIGNPNLTCITVDSVPYSLNKWTQKDSWAFFSTGCSNLCNYVGVESYTDSPTSTIYPNPTTNSITISNNTSTPYNTVIYNISGRIVAQVDNAIDDLKMDLRHLSSGLYYVRIEDGEDRSTHKLVLQ